jgi:hypothetical protein
MLYGLLFFLVLAGCQQTSQSPSPEENPLAIDAGAEDDHELIDDLLFEKASCVRATSAQIATVDMGSAKKANFLNECGQATAGSPWCQQLVRPNPNSISTFYCTYGSQQKHLLIHPDEKTWKYAYQAVNLIERLEANGVRIAQIYNWWRPEPYNKNVGGAAGRHPYGTSVDVRFTSKTDQTKAHSLLCKWRKQGELRALGYYSSTSLHFGIGDFTANTWGKSCP